MTNVFQWIAGKWSDLLANPTAVRDARVQLRGRKGTTVIGLYLLIMMGIVVTFYWNVISTIGPQPDMPTLQQKLQGLFLMIMGALGITVMVVPTMMGAFAVVTERTRKTLELISLAPVRPMDYLIGKLVSSIRFTGMLLIAGMPAIAITLATGGATPADLIVTLAVFLAQAMTFGSIGLLVSSYLRNPILAVTTSAIGVGALSSLGAGGIAILSDGSQNPFAYLNPLTTMLTNAGTVVSIGGLSAPGWVVGILMNVALTAVILGQAAPGIDPTDRKLVRNARIIQTILIYGGLVSFMMLIMPLRENWGAGPSADHNFGICFAAVAGVLGLLMILRATGDDDYSRYRTGQKFEKRHVFTGEAGSLCAYAMLLYGGLIILCLALAVAFNLPYPSFTPVFYGFGFITMMSYLAEFVSSRTESVKTARALIMVWLAGMVLIPTVIAGLLSLQTHGGNRDLGMLHPVTALDPAHPWAAFVYGLIFFSAAYGFRRASRIPPVQKIRFRSVVDVSGNEPVVRTEKILLNHQDDLQEEHLTN